MLGSDVGHAQTVTTTQSITSVTEVTLDYTSRVSSVKVPFDERFSLKITNVPPATKEINVSITRPGRGAAVITVPVAPWKRDPTITETVVYLLIPPLQPLSDYTFVVNAKTLQPLSAAQISALQAALFTDANVGNVINLVAQKAIRDFNQFTSAATRPSYVTSIGTINSQILANVLQSVKNININYELNSLDPATQLSNISSFSDRILDFLDKTRELKTDPAVTGDGNVLTLQTRLQDIVTAMTGANWATITKAAGDAQYLRITSAIAAFRGAFATAAAGATLLRINNLIVNLDDAIDARDIYLGAIVNNIVLPNTSMFSIVPITVDLDFLASSKLFFTADAGIIGYAWGIDRYVNYAGVNIYFREVNKAIPLRNFNGWDRVAVSTSVLIGLTLSTIEQDHVRKGWVGNSAVVLGIGNRLWKFARINAGVLMHYRYDTNPLLDRYHTSASPFVSFSIDLDIKSLFTGFGNALFN